MAWSKNSKAHHWTHKALKATELVARSTKFDAAGTLRIDGLDHWVVGESANNRRTKCDLLAAQMDTLFDFVGGKYEKPGGSAAAKKQAARDALSLVLRTGSDTVPVLGDTVDQHYVFPME